MPRSWFRHGVAAGKSAKETEAAFPLGGCKSTNYYTSGFSTIQAVIDNTWLQGRCALHVKNGLCTFAINDNDFLCSNGNPRTSFPLSR